MSVTDSNSSFQLRSSDSVRAKQLSERYSIATLTANVISQPSVLGVAGDKSCQDAHSAPDWLSPQGDETGRDKHK